MLCILRQPGTLGSSLPVHPLAPRSDNELFLGKSAVTIDWEYNCCEGAKNLTRRTNGSGALRIGDPVTPEVVL